MSDGLPCSSGPLGGALAVLTRAGGGASPLRANLGLHVGDDPVRVHGRRAELSASLARPVVWMEQTHSARVALVDLRRTGPGRREWWCDEAGGPLVDHAVAPGEWGPVAADGVIVDARGWEPTSTGGLGPLQPPPAAAVMTADCLPVLLASGDGAVVAAVHAGRVGLGAGILTRAVDRLRDLGVDPQDLHALVAPSICGRCYEVPEDMAEEFCRTHPAARARTSWGTPALDLARAARELLDGLGVTRVGVSEECTLEEDEWHSHRRTSAAGRQASVIVPLPAARHAERQ